MADTRSPLGDADRAEVERAARETAYDDYAAALLAPAGSVRDDLIIVSAYLGDLARIPLQVSEAALGEIRLQWWRDALTARSGGGHPIAAAMIALQERRSLSLDTVLAPLEARAAELYPDLFPGDAAFEAYAAGVERAHLAMRRQIVEGHTATSMSDDLQDRAARALGLTRTLVRLPHLIAKGRWPLPGPRLKIAGGDDTNPPDQEAISTVLTALARETRQSLAAVTSELRQIRPSERLIFLPLALAEPYLRVLQRRGHDPLRDIAELQPLSRLMRLWLAARLGRF